MHISFISKSLHVICSEINFNMPIITMLKNNKIPTGPSKGISKKYFGTNEKEKIYKNVNTKNGTT